MTDQNTQATILPDGSAFFTASMPLPGGHWLYANMHEAPPMPFRMGTDDPRRQEFNRMVRAAARQAIRASTNNGKIDDYDPDAMVQNFVVAMLGYHTPDGLSHDFPESEDDPIPVPRRLYECMDIISPYYWVTSRVSDE